MVEEPNLLTNGGFEDLPFSCSGYSRTSTSPTGWSTSGSTDVICGLWENQEGNVSVELAGAYSPISLNQSVTTNPGSIYRLSYWVSANPDAGCASYGDDPLTVPRTASVVVSDVGNGAVIAERTEIWDVAEKQNTRTDMGWENRSVTFVATGHETDVGFTAVQGQSCTVVVDNVYAVEDTNVVMVDDPPTADAGEDQAIRAGDTVFLDGSASFDDNTASVNLGYQWTLDTAPAGSTATLIGSMTATPSFTADLSGTYTVTLVVTDAANQTSAPDSVVVSSDNLTPTAVAGPDQLAIVGNTVLLDGSGSSDPENDPLGYSWAITGSPAGSTATLSGSDSATPTLVPDVEGLYDIRLVVSDLLGPGAPDTVTINAVVPEGFAEIIIVESGQVVADLDPTDVTSVGNQNAVGNFLSQAMTAIDSGDIAKAIRKLEEAISRTDGCSLRGAPDGNGPGRDWVTSCPEQVPLYDSLNSALSALTEN